MWNFSNFTGVYRILSNIYERASLLKQLLKMFEKVVIASLNLFINGQSRTPWRARECPENFLDYSYSKSIDYTLILEVTDYKTYKTIKVLTFTNSQFLF